MSRIFTVCDIFTGEQLYTITKKTIDGTPQSKKGNEIFISCKLDPDEILINGRVFTKFDCMVEIDKTEIVQGEYITMSHLKNPSTILISLGGFEHRLNIKKKEQLALSFDIPGIYSLTFVSPSEVDKSIEITVLENTDGKIFESPVVAFVDIVIPDVIVDRIAMKTDSVIKSMEGKTLRQKQSVIDNIKTIDDLKPILLRILDKVF